MSDTAGDIVFLDMSLEELLSLDIRKMSASDAQALDEALQEIEAREVAKKCQTSLLAFCQHIDPSYTIGVHHRRLATLLEQVARGEKDRIAVSVAPRHGKSLLTSTYFPAWFLGNWPKQRVMMVTHTTDLSVDFGRKVRNIIDSPAYRQVFPAIKIASDSKSAGRWGTNAGGEYYATSVGSALAGRGADLLLCDDPHSEQALLAGNAFENFAATFKWFSTGARTRLSKDGRVALIHTRWHAIDLIGSVAREMTRNPEADQYEFFEFPAIINENTDREKALWPEFFDLKTLHRTKASMPAFQWNAQYQQNPTAEEASMVKREWWKVWDKDDPPECEYIIMSLDAAAEANNRADFTALTTWGVFSDDNITQGASHIILLNAINVRVEFPELKDLALREYKEWEPDAFIVEKKSSGTPLFQELRRMGVPVSEFTPHRGTGDKIARLNAVADIFRSGMVWYPAGRRWAEEVIEQVASFPASEHDDLVDCLVAGTQVLMANGAHKSIEDVSVGDLVHTPVGPHKVTQAWCSGVFPTHKLRVGGREIQGTANHPVATTRGWVPLQDVRASDTIKMVSTKGTQATRAPVQGIGVGNAQNVYNLTVEGAQCFYANDVLVHNCASMALSRYRSGGFIRLASDEKDEPALFRSHRNAAYY